MAVQNTSSASNDPLNISAPLDILTDADLGNAMMTLDSASPSITSTGASRHGTSPASIKNLLSPVSNRNRQDSIDALDLNLSSLHDLFPLQADDPVNLLRDGIMSNSPGLTKFRANKPDNGQASTLNGETEKQDAPFQGLSPAMDSFLHYSWTDIQGNIGKPIKNENTFFDPLSPVSPHLAVAPLPSGFGHQIAINSNNILKHIPAFNPSPISLVIPTITRLSSTGSSKSGRKTKQCMVDGCNRRAQSNNRCKSHGGGARCQIPGCDKSSQGGGLCRAHGGGKKCRIAGCTKGTQRLGLCYLHGGIRRCIADGCKKKDRGNGYCISHGGGRRCDVTGCNRPVRKGKHCQTHQQDNHSPFLSGFADSFLVSSEI